MPPDGKPAAREHARDVGAELAADHPEHRGLRAREPGAHRVVRRRRRAMACTRRSPGVIVPKLETPEQLGWPSPTRSPTPGSASCTCSRGSRAPLGVDRVRSCCAPPVAVAYFGAEDYVADMGGVRTLGSTEVLYARSRVALAARLAGVPALDQVVTRLDAEDHFLTDAAEGRALGYRGKLCIHPAQVALANRAFTPSPEEVERARRLVAAYEEAVARRSTPRSRSRARWSTSRWPATPGPSSPRPKLRRIRP